MRDEELLIGQNAIVSLLRERMDGEREKKELQQPVRLHE